MELLRHSAVPCGAGNLACSRLSGGSLGPLEGKPSAPAKSRRQPELAAPLLWTITALLGATLAHGASADVADAAQHRDTAAVRALVTQRANVNAMQADGTTAPAAEAR